MAATGVVFGDERALAYGSAAELWLQGSLKVVRKVTKKVLSPVENRGSHTNLINPHEQVRCHGLPAELHKYGSAD